MSSPARTADERRATARAFALAWRHYLAQVWLDRRVAIPGLFLPGLGNVLVFYVPPLAVAAMLARVADGRATDLGALTPLLLALGLAWLAGEGLWRVGIHLMIKAEVRGMGRLAKQAMDRLLEKDVAFFHDNFAGSLTKRSVAYARNYEATFDTFAFQVLGNLVPVGFAAVMLWRYSPWLVFTLFVFLAVTSFVVVPLIRRRFALVDAREAASNTVAGHISDSISNVEAVRAYAREGHEAEIHQRNVDDHMAKRKRSYDYQNLRIDLVTSPLYVGANVTGLAIAIALAGRGGALSIDAIFVTFTYFMHLTGFVWNFNQIYRNLESAMSEAAQFTELLLEPPRVTDREPVSPFLPADASVTFEGVRFRYHDSTGEHLFDGLDLEVADGERVGLVGRSGGGKTTVTRLLLRFMDIDDGAILVGGQDIATIEQAALRDAIAYVPQEPVMFHRTLADNIRFGRLDATDEDVRRAAEMANAAEFIDALPNGYETLVGERGVKLSGGQRQRIAIARAMIKGAPILVLDEATSSLDSESEHLIQDALWRLMEGRTAIVIAHRLSTVQGMDRLIVLEEGRVIEQGTHRELLGLGGTYARLWARQSGGFLLDDDAPEPEDARATT